MLARARPPVCDGRLPESRRRASGRRCVIALALLRSNALTSAPYAGAANAGGLEGCKPSNQPFLLRCAAKPRSAAETISDQAKREQQLTLGDHAERLADLAQVVGRVHNRGQRAAQLILTLPGLDPAQLLAQAGVGRA